MLNMTSFGSKGIDMEIILWIHTLTYSQNICITNKLKKMFQMFQFYYFNFDNNSRQFKPM